MSLAKRTSLTRSIRQYMENFCILGSVKNEEIDEENENLRNQTVILQESEETVLLKR